MLVGLLINYMRNWTMHRVGHYDPLRFESDDMNNIVVRIYDPGVTRMKIAITIIYESGCAGYLRSVDDKKNWIEFTVFVGRY